MISSGSEVRAHLASIRFKGQEISRAHLAAIGCNGLKHPNTMHRLSLSSQQGIDSHEMIHHQYFSMMGICSTRILLKFLMVMARKGTKFTNSVQANTSWNYTVVWWMKTGCREKKAIPYYRRKWRGSKKLQTPCGEATRKAKDEVTIIDQKLDEKHHEVYSLNN